MYSADIGRSWIVPLMPRLSSIGLPAFPMACGGAKFRVLWVPA
jgi:hypothetical protein